jgi:hypothetical protein
MSRIHRYQGTADALVPGESFVTALVVNEYTLQFTRIPLKAFSPADRARLDQSHKIEVRICPRAERARIVT